MRYQSSAIGKGVLIAMIAFCGGALADPPAIRPSNGPFGQEKSYRKLYESGRFTIIQANVLSTDDIKLLDTGDPFIQIKMATETNDILLNMGARWFASDHDILFTH